MRRNLGPETDQLIDKKINEGRGQGRLADYKPWIEVGEFRSRGEQQIVVSRKTGRSHHYFSKLESDYHSMVEFDPRIIDIREQYPILPRSQTMKIAELNDIRHPAFAGLPTVITFDFVLTVLENRKQVTLVRSVKRSKDLAKARVLEKLELERRICDRLGYEYKIVTENDMPTQRVKNLAFLWSWTLSDLPAPKPELVRAFLTSLAECDIEDPLVGQLETIAKGIDISRHLSIWLFKYLCWGQKIRVDMTTRLELGLPHNFQITN
jgi:hypothetical protein